MLGSRVSAGRPGPLRDLGRRLLQSAWRFYFAYRPLIVAGMALYLVGIHVVALGLFWQSQWPGLIVWKLGLGSRWVELDRFFKARRNQTERRANAVEPGAVLFIGDSQLAALDTSALTDRAVQLAIPGDTARRVATRLRDYWRMDQAKLIFLHVGTNDLFFRTPEEMEKPFARIFRTLPHNVPVMLNAILPVDERLFNAYTNADIAAANAVMARMCAAHPNCTWVDTSDKLKDATGNLDPRFHERHEGLHLSIEGNRVWRASLEPTLAPWRSF
jgi:lysophospholipase L1-like esterase